MIRKKISYKDKVKILLKPYISKKDIQMVLDCTYNEAEEIFLNVQKYLVKNEYLILNAYKIPSKLFLKLSNLTINEYIEKAKIEKEICNEKNSINVCLSR